MIKRQKLFTTGVRSPAPLVLLLLVLGVCYDAAAQNTGIMANGRDRVVIFDADSGAVLNEFPLGAQNNAGAFGDCEITSDGTLALLSDSESRGVWAIDLTTSPPGLDPELIPLPSSIPIDLTITHDDRFAVVGSNSHINAPINVIDIAARTRASRLFNTSTQSVAACDDGSIVGTSWVGRAQRFEIDESGTIRRVNQASIPPFFINSACAPGSQTAVIVNNNTSVFGNGQNRSVGLPGMASIEVVGTGRESNGSLLMSRDGTKLYIRRLRSIVGLNYDPLAGDIDPAPFMEIGGLTTATAFGAGETMALHPDGSRLFLPTGRRIDVYSTADGTFLGSVEDPAIIGSGVICANPEPAAPVALVADAGGPYIVAEGTSILLDASGSIGTITSFEWDFDFDGTSFTADATGAMPTFDAAELDGPDVRVVALRVADGLGNEDTVATTIDILNVAPTADAGGPYVVDEGGSVMLSGIGDDVPADLADLIYEWDLDGDGQFDDAFGPMPVLDAAALNGPDIVTVSLRVSDDDGGTSSGGGSGGPATADLHVENVAPEVDEITGLPSDPETITRTLTVSAEFFDAGVGDVHTATWYWGDGTTSSGAVTSNGDGTGIVTGNHLYSVPGVYVVAVSIDDGDGGLVEATNEDLVVVYDPQGGFVTGGGWIDSAPGAYRPDPALTGSANFGFVAKYKKGASVPSGSTEFQFQAGDLNFHSREYDWLVVAGSRAQFKGRGTVNGQAGYGFMLTAIDGALSGGGGADRFRMKIWDIAADTLLYDNQVGTDDSADPVTELTGGSIVIHTKGNK